MQTKITQQLDILYFCDDTAIHSICCTKPLVEQTKAHVIIRFLFRFFFLLFLLLLFLSFLCSSTATSSSTTNSWGSSNIADEISNVPSFKSFGKQTWPERFKVNVCCFHDSCKLLSGDCNVIVVQNEGGINASKFGYCSVGHFSRCRLLKSVDLYGFKALAQRELYNFQNVFGKERAK